MGQGVPSAATAATAASSNTSAGNVRDYKSAAATPAVALAHINQSLSKPNTEQKHELPLDKILAEVEKTLLANPILSSVQPNKELAAAVLIQIFPLLSVAQQSDIATRLFAPIYKYILVMKLEVQHGYKTPCHPVWSNFIYLFHLFFQYRLFGHSINIPLFFLLPRDFFRRMKDADTFELEPDRDWQRLEWNIRTLETHRDWQRSNDNIEHFLPHPAVELLKKNLQDLMNGDRQRLEQNIQALLSDIEWTTLGPNTRDMDLATLERHIAAIKLQKSNPAHKADSDWQSLEHHIRTFVPAGADWQRDIRTLKRFLLVEANPRLRSKWALKPLLDTFFEELLYRSSLVSHYLNTFQLSATSPEDFPEYSYCFRLFNLCQKASRFVTGIKHYQLTDEVLAKINEKFSSRNTNSIQQITYVFLLHQLNIETGMQDLSAVINNFLVGLKTASIYHKTISCIVFYYLADCLALRNLNLSPLIDALQEVLLLNLPAASKLGRQHKIDNAVKDIKCYALRALGQLANGLPAGEYCALVKKVANNQHVQSNLHEFLYELKLPLPIIENDFLLHLLKIYINRLPANSANEEPEQPYRVCGIAEHIIVRLATPAGAVYLVEKLMLEIVNVERLAMMPVMRLHLLRATVFNARESNLLNAKVNAANYLMLTELLPHNIGLANLVHEYAGLLIPTPTVTPDAKSVAKIKATATTSTATAAPHPTVRHGHPAAAGATTACAAATAAAGATPPVTAKGCVLM